jgi:hypothetical protein
MRLLDAIKTGLELIKKEDEAKKAAQTQAQEMDRLVTSDLKYSLLQKMVNEARTGAKILVTLKDGTRLEILPVDRFDQERITRRPTQQNAYL